MSSWTETAQAIAPYLSGGLAGAVFTFLVNRWLNSGRQRRLRVEKRITKYALPSDARAGKLQISYAGVDYASLTLLELKFINNSKVVIQDNPVVINLPAAAIILQQEVTVTPVGAPFKVDQANLKENQHRYSFEALHPNDTVFIEMLLAGVGDEDVSYHYRGKDDVTISTSEVNDRGGDADDIRALALYAAMYTLFGVDSVLGAPAQALMVVLCTRHVIRLYTRWTERRDQCG